MGPRLSSRMAVVVASLVALVAAAISNRVAPAPAADVAAGTETCFGSGLFGRELPPPARTPQRWTTERAAFRFRDLPRGPLRVRVEVHGQRAPVVVAVEGQVVGAIPREARSGEWTVASESRSLNVELRVEPFVGWGGRRLGALLDRVVVFHAPATVPSFFLLLAFLVPALAVVACAVAASVPPVLALCAAAVVSTLQALALAPSGLVRSDYVLLLAGVLSLAPLVALGLARALERRQAGLAAWAFTGILVAELVQGVAATSPMMVVSDAEFHANKLATVARGEGFPTSITPGDRPFRFPYGVSFYAVLAPLAQAGLDRGLLVRYGAAIAGIAASAAIMALLVPWGARRAGLATVLLQLLPVTFDLYSYGNLSNIFGQAATVGFFAWWCAAPPRRSALVGATLLATGCLAHFSSLIVLVAVCAALAAIEGRSLAADRRRAVGLLAGLAIAALYYSHFLPLVLEQIPHLAERSGTARPWVGSMARQVRAAVEQWGIPAMALGTLGLGVFHRAPLDLRRGLGAWALAGASLGVVAIVSPVEVRYLYALTLPVAVVAAVGADWLVERGPGGVALAALLLLWQLVLAGQGIALGLVHRYRA
jgi:hypothetical protein